MWIGKHWNRPASHSSCERLTSAWSVSEVGFFLRSEGYPKKSDPASYRLNEIPFGKNWPIFGMTIGRTMYTLKSWDHRSSSASIWPTPCALDYIAPKTDVALNRVMTEIRPGRNGAPGLKDDRRLLGYTDPLQKETEWSGLWPTPRAANPGSRPNGKGGKILEEEILISVGLRNRGGKANPVSGSLNPDWVEWLMGYPRGWTIEERCGSI